MEDKKKAEGYTKERERERGSSFVKEKTGERI